MHNLYLYLYIYIYIKIYIDTFVYIRSRIYTYIRSPLPLFPTIFRFFWDRISSRSEIGLRFNVRSQIEEMSISEATEMESDHYMKVKREARSQKNVNQNEVRLKMDFVRSQIFLKYGNRLVRRLPHFDFSHLGRILYIHIYIYVQLRWNGGGLMDKSAAAKKSSIVWVYIYIMCTNFTFIYISTCTYIYIYICIYICVYMQLRSDVDGLMDKSATAAESSTVWGYIQYVHDV